MAGENEIGVVLKLVADQFQREMKNSQGLLGQFQRVILDWRTQLTAVATALVTTAKVTANYGDELAKTSQKVGVAVEELSALRHAASLSDVSMEQLSQGLGQLARNAVEAAQGTKEQKEAFDFLNISVRDSNGSIKGTSQLLLELNDRFRFMADGPEKTAAAMTIMGKAGKEFIPLLNSDLREASEEAQRLGLVMSTENAKAGEEFNDAITRLQAALKGLTFDLGNTLIPALTGVTNMVRGMIEDFRALKGAIEGAMRIPELKDFAERFVDPKTGRSMKVLPAPEGADKVPVPETLIPKAEDLKKQEEIGKRIVENAISLFKINESLKKQEEEKGRALLELFQIQQRSKQLLEDQAALTQEGLGRATVFNAVNAARRQAEEEAQRARDQEGIGRAEVANIIAKREQISRELERYFRDEQLMEQRVVREVEELWRERTAEIKADLAELQQRRSEMMADFANPPSATALTTLDQEARRKEFDLSTIQMQQELDRVQTTEEEKFQIRREWRARFRKMEADIEAEIEAETARQNLGIMERFGLELARFASDDGPFGMMRQAAQATFQFLNQTFNQIFLNVLENRVNSFKDVMRTVVDFAKQLVAQMLAMAATMAVIRAVGFGFAGPAALLVQSGGVPAIRKFSLGGPAFSNGDRIPALLQSGEAVISKQGMATIDRINRGEVGAFGLGRSANITVNVHGSRPDQRVTARSHFDESLKAQVINIMLENIAQNGVLRQAGAF